MTNKMIFVNLPVTDLQKSMDFFTALGYSFDKSFTDENAASLVIGENIYAMLVTQPFFSTFTTKEIVDATKSTEVLIALSAESREEVDLLVDKAVTAGATISQDPEDQGFMYSRTFDDSVSPTLCGASY